MGFKNEDDADCYGDYLKEVADDRVAEETTIIHSTPLRVRVFWSVCEEYLHVEINRGRIKVASFECYDGELCELDSGTDPVDRTFTPDETHAINRAILRARE